MLDANNAFDVVIGPDDASRLAGLPESARDAARLLLYRDIGEICTGNGDVCCAGAECCPDGCRDLNVDENNCGACGNACGAGTSCSNGYCCPNGTRACGDVCVPMAMPCP